MEMGWLDHVGQRGVEQQKLEGYGGNRRLLNSRRRKPVESQDVQR